MLNFLADIKFSQQLIEDYCNDDGSDYSYGLSSYDEYTDYSAYITFEKIIEQKVYLPFTKLLYEADKTNNSALIIKNIEYILDEYHLYNIGGVAIIEYLIFNNYVKIDDLTQFESYIDSNSDPMVVEFYTKKYIEYDMIPSNYLITLITYDFINDANILVNHLVKNNLDLMIDPDPSTIDFQSDCDDETTTTISINPDTINELVNNIIDHYMCYLYIDKKNSYAKLLEGIIMKKYLDNFQTLSNKIINVFIQHGLLFDLHTFLYLRKDCENSSICNMIYEKIDIINFKFDEYIIDYIFATDISFSIVDKMGKNIYFNIDWCEIVQAAMNNIYIEKSVVIKLLSYLDTRYIDITFVADRMSIFSQELNDFLLKNPYVKFSQASNFIVDDILEKSYFDLLDARKIPIPYEMYNIKVDPCPPRLINLQSIIDSYRNAYDNNYLDAGKLLAGIIEFINVHKNKFTYKSKLSEQLIITFGDVININKI